MRCRVVVTGKCSRDGEEKIDFERASAAWHLRMKANFMLKSRLAGTKQA